MADNLWNSGGYNIPYPIYTDPQQAMPTAGWYNNMSPEVRAGLWEPYEQGADLLTERMGAGGQAGSASGGMSGAYGDAMGRYYADAQKGVGMQAWQMQQPALMQAMQQNYGSGMAGWQSILGRNQNLWQQNLQQQMYPYQVMQSLFGQAGQSTPVVNPGDQSGQQAMQLASMIAMMAMMA